MIEEYYLGVLPFVWVPSNKDVSWVGVAMHVTVLKDHLREDFNKQRGDTFGISKLFLQALHIVDLSAFYKLHHNSPPTA